MKPEQRELFRRAILEAADANGSRFGLTAGALRIHLTPFGFPAAAVEDIRTETLYLADKGLLAEVPKMVSPENRAWRITAEGRDYLATQP